MNKIADSTHIKRKATADHEKQLLRLISTTSRTNKKPFYLIITFLKREIEFNYQVMYNTNTILNLAVYPQQTI